MSKTHDKFIEAVTELIQEEGYANSLTIISPVFIFIVEEMMEHKGLPKDQQIRIEPEKGRSICIEATAKSEGWGL